MAKILPSAFEILFDVAINKTDKMSLGSAEILATQALARGQTCQDAD